MVLVSKTFLLVEFGQSIVIYSYIDLLGYGASNQVAQVELFHVFVVLACGIRDLELCSIGHLHEGVEVIGTDECSSWVDAGICSHGCDQYQVNMDASTEFAWDRFSISSDFFLELNQIFVCLCTWSCRQRRIWKQSLTLLVEFIFSQCLIDVIFVLIVPEEIFKR